MRGALIQRPPCDRLLLVTSASTTYSNIYDPGSADGRCPPPIPFLWCAVVWWWVASRLPVPVVWSGVGSACCGSPLPPLWHGVGSGYLAVATPCVFGSALLIPMMTMMARGETMITIFMINSNILMFLWLVVGCLLPTCLATISLY